MSMRREFLPLQKYCRQVLDMPAGRLPNIEGNSVRICSLPLFPP